ncbi:tRNA epoxyqueuosine(34) reductase QueG [uncultured Bacteroides sp.]|uniref:tRNA epoxyqueuosine(34) reductase QueG n=1 Tax=uncultured Bacteroides sp. TaxID=162156 RepID=UPI002AABEC22|nr:tRNA epoxyqueuosine(34) reductase QueG [uncultured Bacteroides sp.]
MNKETLSQQIKAEALRLGFSACGIARADFVGENKIHLEQWLAEGNQAGMSYMANHLDKRCDPRLLVEGTKSVISVALNYYPSRKLKEDQLQFAYYAYGQDYHEVMKAKLTSLFNYINEQLQPVNGRVFCDTAPILDRYWAWQAGLGWIGKNTQLIIPHAGSYFFLGEILVDIEMDYDSPMKSKCGNCKRCLDVCPTKALEKPFCLNSNRCISYLTIENKNEIQAEYAAEMGSHLYGCDDCQKCCPWNRFATPQKTPELEPSEAFLSMKRQDWASLTIEQYRTLFKGSAVKRAKYDGLMRNLKAILPEN